MQIIPADSGKPLSMARNLFREYGSAPDVVPCVADFERELASLPGAYASPGGRLLLAVANGTIGGEEAAGCVALRRWQQDTCEMKRLYVRPEFRGQGAGRELVQALLSEAREIGYARMVLDTLPSMKAAHQLYRSLGFREIPSYQKDPISGALFFELTLR